MRLIDADRLYNIFKNCVIRIPLVEEDRDLFYHNSGYNCAMTGAYIEVEKAPTIEAVPVVHGKWERTNITCEDGWALYRCTNCDWHTTYYYSFSASPTYNFCPNCGADMRGKEHI
jgi:hypothetical protein